MRHPILWMQGIKAYLIYIDHLISLNDHLLNNEYLGLWGLGNVKK